MSFLCSCYSFLVSFKRSSRTCASSFAICRSRFSHTSHGMKRCKIDEYAYENDSKFSCLFYTFSMQFQFDSLARSPVVASRSHCFHSKYKLLSFSGLESSNVHDACMKYCRSFFLPLLSLCCLHGVRSALCQQTDTYKMATHTPQNEDINIASRERETRKVIPSAFIAPTS